MTIYSNDIELSSFAERAYASILENGYSVEPESFKEIGYGISFKVLDKNSKKEISVAIYHTEKKGFSFVTKDEKIRYILNMLLTSVDVAGSDEAGKGDFFGPLVVCCFIFGEKEKNILKLDIKDSKKLSNEKILGIYSRISSEFRDSFSTVRIMPERYNTFYSELSKNGKNLNFMLAWAHAKAISLLFEKRPDAKKLIVDRFSENPAINRLISTAAGSVSVEFIVRAEQNPAVAIASIIARAEYLNSLKQLSSSALENKFNLISGSGEQSDILLSQIRKTMGEECLKKICKMHFANYAGKIISETGTSQ